jgi:hypothetical protein
VPNAVFFSGRRRNSDINLFFDGSRSMREGFSVPLSRMTTCRGVIMSLSTFVVLLALTFGQSALLTLGLFVLWLAGEIGGGGR